LDAKAAEEKKKTFSGNFHRKYDTGKRKRTRKRKRKAAEEMLRLSSGGKISLVCRAKRSFPP